MDVDEAEIQVEQRRAAAIEDTCRLFHDEYEKAAAGAGWETQEASRKPWEEVPEANKETMRQTVGAVLPRIMFSNGNAISQVLMQHGEVKAALLVMIMISDLVEEGEDDDDKDDSGE